jgi:hypothetical protein
MWTCDVMLSLLLFLFFVFRSFHDDKPNHPLQRMAGVRTPPLYEALGVPVVASASDIARAFRSASLRLHPDRNIGVPSEDLNDAFQVISSAYAVLSDPEKKNAYDAKHGVNFHARIAALQSAAEGAATIAHPDQSGDAWSDASRKRDRREAEEEDDEEYDPTACDAQAPADALATDAIHSGHRAPAPTSSNTVPSPLVAWSAIPVSSRHTVTMLVHRKSPSQKWGIDCAVMPAHEIEGYTPSVKGVTSCLVFKPPGPAVDGEEGQLTPTCGLPRSSSLHHVVLEAVDNASVATVADLVRCLGVKTSIALTLSVGGLHTVRMDVTSMDSERRDGVAWEHFHAAFTVRRSTFRIERTAEVITGSTVAPEGVVQMLRGARLLGARLLHSYERHAEGHLPFVIFAHDHEVDVFAAEASEAGDASLELLISH